MKSSLPVMFLSAILVLLSLKGFSQADTVVNIPLGIAKLIDRDLRIKDKQDTLIQLQSLKIGMLERQVVGMDSIILIDSMREKALGGLMAITLQEERGRTEAEKKRRKSNGIWRDVFIGTTAALIYLIAKPN